MSSRPGATMGVEEGSHAWEELLAGREYAHLCLLGKSTGIKRNIPDYMSHHSSNESGGAGDPGRSSRFQPFGCKAHGGQRTSARPPPALGGLPILTMLREQAQHGQSAGRGTHSPNPPLITGQGTTEGRYMVLLRPVTGAPLLPPFPALSGHGRSP